MRDQVAGTEGERRRLRCSFDEPALYGGGVKIFFLENLTRWGTSARDEPLRGEPRRVSRRLHILRRRGHGDVEPEQQILVKLLNDCRLGPGLMQVTTARPEDKPPPRRGDPRLL